VILTHPRERVNAAQDHRPAPGQKGAVSLRFAPQGTVFEVGVKGAAPGTNHGGVRKPSTELTYKARMGLLKRGHQVSWEACRALVFMTLTFPEYADQAKTERLARDVDTIKDALEAFEARMQRAGWAQWFFWKLEWGERTHREHFHLLLDAPAGRIPLEWARAAWREILQGKFGLRDGECWGVEIEAVRDPAAVRRYLAPYCAKGANTASVSGSDALGGGRDSAPPGASSSGSLVSYPNSHAGARRVGRLWGVRGRKNVPWADGGEAETALEVTFVWCKLRRAFRAYVKAQRRDELSRLVKGDPRRRVLVKKMKSFGRGKLYQGRTVFFLQPSTTVKMLDYLLQLAAECPPECLSRGLDEEMGYSPPEDVDELTRRALEGWQHAQDEDSRTLRKNARRH
jgi:hypothetical protein